MATYTSSLIGQILLWSPYIAIFVLSNILYTYVIVLQIYNNEKYPHMQLYLVVNTPAEYIHYILAFDYINFKCILDYN